MKFKLRRYLAIIQIGLSPILILIGLVFPIYIYARYGLETYPVYDRSTSTYVHYSFFIYAVAMGAIFIGVGIFCLVLALQYLRKITK